METDRKKITEENLIRCGREEFLEKGYAGANLRDICKRAGVTTGAFYFSFENKEALLGAILDPLIAEYQKMMYEITKREQEHPETAEQNEREIMEYICAHRQECELVLEKCSGSKYESFRDVVFNNMFTVEAAGLPVVHMCTVTPISMTVGANRIVPTIAIPHPLGNPALEKDEEYALRKGLVEKALKALTTEVDGQTIFDN